MRYRGLLGGFRRTHAQLKNRNPGPTSFSNKPDCAIILFSVCFIDAPDKAIKQSRDLKYVLFFLTTGHIYCACASFPEGFSAPRSVVPYFNRPVLSHVHRSFASMDVYGLLEIHSCQEC